MPSETVASAERTRAISGGLDSERTLRDTRPEGENGALGRRNPGQLETDDANHEDAGRAQTNISSPFVRLNLSLPKEIVFVAIVCCAQLMTQAGLSQVLSTMHVIGDHYHLRTPGDLSWFPAAYSLTVGTFILVSGRLGDLFGHKRMLIIGYLWFSLWSLVAGLAAYSNDFLFNFARALQGIGPSILLPNGLALFGQMYPAGPRKNMVFALFGAAAPNGSMLGAVFAALFAQKAWWPWAFWSFAIVLCGLALLAQIAVPDPQTSDSAPRDESFFTKIRDIDLLGAGTGIAALVLINISWNQAPIVGWDHSYVYILLVLGFLFIPAFFYIELCVARKPLLPLDALKKPEIGFVLGCMACGWGCFGVWLYYFWQIYLELRHATPLLATSWISPVAVSGALAAVITGRLLGHVGPAWTMFAAMSFFLIGVTLIATMPVHQSYWLQGFLCTVIMPWGMDMSFPAGAVILSDAVRRRHQGIGASLVNTVVNYSISLALGLAGTVEVRINPSGMSEGELLRGYRAALYVGIGLACVGWVLSAVFVMYSYRKKGRGRE